MDVDETIQPMSKNGTWSSPVRAGLCLLSLIVLRAEVVLAQPIIITSNVVVVSSDSLYEHEDLVVSNATLTVEGSHQFGLLTLTNQAVVSVQGGNLSCAGLDVNASTCWLHNAASLTVTSNVHLSSNSVIWCKGANRSNKVNGVWAGVGVTIAANNIIVDANSRIAVDGLGYVAKGDVCGPGGGGYGSNGGAGGAYGGRVDTVLVGDRSPCPTGPQTYPWIWAPLAAVTVATVGARSACRSGGRLPWMAR